MTSIVLQSWIFIITFIESERERELFLKVQAVYNRKMEPKIKYHLSTISATLSNYKLGVNDWCC